MVEPSRRGRGASEVVFAWRLLEENEKAGEQASCRRRDYAGSFRLTAEPSAAHGRARLRPRAEAPQASGKMPPARLPTARRAGAAARNKETEGKEKEEPSPHIPYKKKEKRKGKKV